MTEPMVEVQNLSFEAAFKQLEQVISELESGELELDRAIALFEKGRTLVEYCSNLLAQAELKVKMLEGGELKDFSIE